jgi:hypothetical protein
MRMYDMRYSRREREESLTELTDEELQARIRTLRALGDEESLLAARRLEATLRRREFVRRLRADGRAYMKVDTDALGPDAGPES